MFTSKSKTHTEESSAASNSIVGAGNLISGNIETSGDLRIDGTLKGNVYSKAKVLIGPSGVVEGNISCRQADIMGHITGCIKVSDLLQLKGKATVDGDIDASKLMIESTVSFNGQCRMGANIVELNPEMPVAVNE